MNKVVCNIYKVSDYINHSKFLGFYLDAVFSTLSQLEYDYPAFRQWYYGKVIPGLHTKERDIVFTVSSDNYISGILILKNNIIENKICTLRVPERFQYNGIGKYLIRESFRTLNIEKPMITVSSKKEPEFRKLFAYFGFDKTEEKINYYANNKREIVFNGSLI